MNEVEGRRLAAHARRIGRYANAFQVGFNAFELVIEFGEQFSDGEQTQAHTRIVTNPIYAQALLRTLQASLQEYEQSFGAEVAERRGGADS